MFYDGFGALPWPQSQPTKVELAQVVESFSDQTLVRILEQGGHPDRARASNTVLEIRAVERELDRRRCNRAEWDRRKAGRR